MGKEPSGNQVRLLIIISFVVITLPLLFGFVIFFGTIKEDTGVYTKPSAVNYSEEFFFHAYWQKGFGRKQAFSVKSLLVTQSAIFKKFKGAKVMLWLEEDYEEDTPNVWVQQMRQLGVEVRHFDPPVEAIGTPLENNSVVTKGYKKTAFHSDWARLIVLYKYGGLYFDMDILFLRDVLPLVEEYGDFAYPWITRNGKINNAFLAFRKQDEAITDIITRAAAENRATGLHGFTGFLVRSKPPTLNLIPYKLIDFCWIERRLCPHFDFRWFFKVLPKNINEERVAQEGLSTSYVYHWHNCWNEPIQDNSTFEIYERSFDSALGVAHNVGNSRS